MPALRATNWKRLRKLWRRRCETVSALIKRILARCPVTKKLNVTGGVIEEAGFAAANLKPGMVACSHCGAKHRWSKEQAIVARYDKFRARELRRLRRASLMFDLGARQG